MVDVDSLHIASKCSWMKRLVYTENSSWKILTMKMLGLNEHLLNKKINLEIINNSLTPFHKQVLESWYKIYSTSPINNIEISNEFVLFNREILIGRRPIKLNQFPNKNGYNLKIMDIIDENGKILPRRTLNQKLNSRLNLMSYNSVITSIPKHWKESLTNKPLDLKMCWPEDIQIKIQNKYVSLKKVKNNEIYRQLITTISKAPTSIETWIETYPFLETHDWKDSFCLPYKVLKETYLQSFQYKIITRNLNCNYSLFKWKIKNSPKCDSCDMVDTIQHHLFQCNLTKVFWKNVEEWIYRSLEIKFNFTECEIIFGIPFNNDPILEIINYILIIGKWYINHMKTIAKNVTIFEFMKTLKGKIKAICELQTIKGINENDYFHIILSTIQ